MCVGAPESPKPKADSGEISPALILSEPSAVSFAKKQTRLPDFMSKGNVWPQEVDNLRVFFIVALIVNGVVTVVWLISAVAGGIATCGIGCLLVVIPMVTGFACVLDAIAISKIGGPPSPSVRSFLNFAAIADIVAGAVGVSLVPLVMGILSMVFLQKPEVQRYFA